MKRTKVILLIGAVVLLAATLAYAADKANIGITAKVPNSSPQIVVQIKELTAEGQEPWTGSDATEMSFGDLTHTLVAGGDAGVWYSPKYFCVFMFTTSYGNKYEVRSTCNGLSSGASTLPAGSFMLTPGYAQEDEWSEGNSQGAQPADSKLGNVDSAIGTDKVIYTSEAAGTNRIIRTFYSLPSYKAGSAKPYEGYTPIPLDQPAGTYTGTVTISIAAL